MVLLFLAEALKNFLKNAFFQFMSNYIRTAVVENRRHGWSAVVLNTMSLMRFCKWYIYCSTYKTLLHKTVTKISTGL